MSGSPDEVDGAAGAPDWLVAGLARIERSAVLERAAAVLARATAPPAAPPRAEVLRGRWFGHAVHPLLTDFPLGTWMSASYLDLLGGRRARPAATGLLALGLATALPTIATGTVDPRLRRSTA
jgi:hypothetical protein